MKGESAAAAGYQTEAQTTAAMFHDSSVARGAAHINSPQLHEVQTEDGKQWMLCCDSHVFWQKLETFSKQSFQKQTRTREEADSDPVQMENRKKH